jgi:hypothetical protein
MAKLTNSATRYGEEWKKKKKKQQHRFAIKNTRAIIINRTLNVHSNLHTRMCSLRERVTQLQFVCIMVFFLLFSSIVHSRLVRYINHIHGVMDATVPWHNTSNPGTTCGVMVMQNVICVEIIRWPMADLYNFVFRNGKKKCWLGTTTTGNERRMLSIELSLNTKKKTRVFRIFCDDKNSYEYLQ